jgi:hypothetical protein
MSRAFFLPLLAGFALLGCGKSPLSPPAQSPAAETPTASVEEVIHIDATQLTVDEYLPPLDGGRIEIAPPTGWHAMPRDRDYIVRFFKDDRNSLPRIIIKVEEGPVGGISDATAENIKQVALALGEELAAKETALVEPVIPVVIGEMPCARYVSNVKLKLDRNFIVVERQTLVVVRGGRRYSIDVLVLPGRLLQGKDAAYAVCAGLRFPKPSAAPDPTETPQPADEPTAAPEASTSEPASP